MTALDRSIDAVTRHSHVVVLLALAITAGMLVGIAEAEMGGEGGFAGAVDTTVDEKESYIRAHYGDGASGEGSVAHFPVYVRDRDRNVLSKDGLLATLRYQRAVADAEPVARARTGEPVLSVASLVGARAAAARDATRSERIDAIEAADADEVAALVRATIEADERAPLLLPDSYDPGTATAESTQVVFAFEPAADGRPPVDAQAALHGAAGERADPAFFTLGAAATERQVATQLSNAMTLVLPIVLALILGVAWFAYRDVADVLVGVTGVVVSIVWMFGTLGWLGVDVGPAVVIGPVLIAGLSIDFGFHVFMRFRERRGPDDAVGPSMARSLRAVAVAFGLVTLTTAIGFLSNLANPVGALRTLGVAIAVGVVCAFAVFVTFVPALKVSVDRALERFGLDRRTRPLGRGARIRPLLASSVALARRAAPVVIAVAVLLAAGGAVAWTTLDRETTQGPDGDVAEWKQELPGPLGWEDNEPLRNGAYVGEQFRTAATDADDRVQILVEGSVTDDGALSAVEAGIDRGVDRGVFAEQRRASVRTPATVIRTVAAEDAAFAETVRAADADGDGVPDTDLETVYDRLFAIAPDRASDVIERRDGEYRSLRVVGPPQAADTATAGGDRAVALFAVGDAIEATDADLTATVVSDATAEQAAVERITDGIVVVTLVALLAVFLALVAGFRLVHGSATLGAVTAAPVATVIGFVVLGMAALDVPLTFLTALLVSLVIGIGVDYAIHLGDRFAAELDRGRSPFDALETAVTGTGGALLGSMLTSVAAFAGMLVHPNPGFEDFAALVVLALVGAFLASAVALPSFLSVWAPYADAVTETDPDGPTAPSANVGDD